MNASSEIQGSAAGPLRRPWQAVYKDAAAFMGSGVLAGLICGVLTAASAGDGAVAPSRAAPSSKAVKPLRNVRREREVFMPGD